VREKAFLPEALSNPDIAALEDKLTLTLDPECAAKFPKNRTAKVEIDLNDGRTLQHHQVTRHGDPDEPLTDQELLDKFYELVSPRVGEQKSLLLADQVMGSASLMADDLSRVWGQKLYV
jgi:2-methylcitrate dehydratase PrpD